MNALKLETNLMSARGRGNGERAAALLEVLRGTDTAAVASDLAGHVLVWNPGAEKLLRRPARQALGRFCHDLLEGRDIFGNRFCHEGCAVRAMCLTGEAVQAFELVVDSPKPDTTFQVSILMVPGESPGEEVIVHLLQPVDREGRLAREFERLGLTSRATPVVAAGPQGGPSLAPLTIREKDVLGHMAEGLQNKEIAQKLEISLATVRNHVHNLLEKLGVHSKLEAISLAYRAGWVAGPKEPRNGRPGPTALPLD